MKPTRARSNSYRKLLEEKTESSIAKSNEMGRTVIPVGQLETVIRLPQIENTVHYSVLKTEKLDSNLVVSHRSRSGFFKGLLLNNIDGSLSIKTVDHPYRSFIMNNTSPDGSGLDFLSNGSDWFFWGFLADGDISESMFDPTITETEEEEELLTGWRLQIITYLCEKYGVCCGEDCAEKSLEELEEIQEAIETFLETGVADPEKLKPTGGEVNTGKGGNGTGGNNNNVINGCCVAPGSKVTVTITDPTTGETTSEETTANENGEWSSGLLDDKTEEGEYTVIVVITNPTTGLESDPVETSYIIDDTAPIVTFNGLTTIIVNQAPEDPGVTVVDTSSYTVESTWDVVALNLLEANEKAQVTYIVTDAGGLSTTLEVTILAIEVAIPEEGSEGAIGDIYDENGDPIPNNGIYSSNGEQGTFKLLLQNDTVHFSLWFRNDLEGQESAFLFRGRVPGQIGTNYALNISVDSNGLIFNNRLRRTNAGNSRYLDSSQLNPPINVMDGNWHHLTFSAERDYDGGGKYRFWASVDGNYSEISYSSLDNDELPGQGLVWENQVIDETTTIKVPGDVTLGESGKFISMAQVEISEIWLPSPNQVIHAYNEGGFGVLMGDAINTPDERNDYSIIVENFEESGPFSNRTNLDNIVDENGDLVVHGVIDGSNGYKYDPYHYDPSKMEGRTYSAWFYLDAPLPANSFKTIVGKYGWYSGGNTNQYIGGWTFGVFKDSTSGQDALQFRIRRGLNNQNGELRFINKSLDSNFAAGQWHHVVVSYSLGECSIYLNGDSVVQNDSSTFASADFRNLKTPSSTTTAEGKLTFGPIDSQVVTFGVGVTNSTAFGGALNTNPFDFGKINQVGVYYGVMTPAEVQALYINQNTNP